MRKVTQLIFLVLLLGIYPGSGFFVTAVKGQGLLGPASDTGGLYDMFEEDRFQDLPDQEIMKREFQKKRQWYQSLLTKKSPIFFKADYQEFVEEERLYILQGNVRIWKDDFKIMGDKVTINQWTGDIHAEGNVELHFNEDTLTGDSAVYNYDTGEGWLTNARGAINPSIFLEGDLIEKLVDYEKNGEGQYALHNGFVTACTGDSPDWRVKSKYALIRIENYAHMNRSSFWISKLPVFYLPYWFFPTKSDRATGLLIPNIAYSNRRGVVITDDFFWAINDRTDITLGGTYYSLVGLEENFQWRNAIDQYSRGELNLQHIKERKSLHLDRDSKERWRGTYEQSYLFPYDIRATVNLDFTSDQYFDHDYGYELEQQADRFMESRISLTKNWDLAHITLDGVYEKDFDQYHDETMQHFPRLDYSTGSQTLFGDLKGIIMWKTENIKREGKIANSFDFIGNTIRVEDWLEREGIRSEIYTELWYTYDDIGWFQIQPFIGLRETVWDQKKVYDPDNIFETWATYPEELPESEKKFLAGVSESGDWIRREMYTYGVGWTGPRFYRIYSLLGFENVSKIKHLVEPAISFKVSPEVIQDEIIEFDADDRRVPEQSLTYSLTNRFLVKLKPKSKKDKSKDKDFGFQMTKHVADGSVPEEESEEPSASAVPQTIDSDALDTPENEDAETAGEDQIETKIDSTEAGKVAAEDVGEIREFANFRISQTYDFFKASEWDKKEIDEGEDERPYYPLSNIMLDATVNPFYNIYYSARIEYDPYRNGFSNGYLYGHTRSKKWKLGVRWDYTKNFLESLYDLHTLALEGGLFINENWSFASWVKYNFVQEFFPYVNLDITYSSQCWAFTLHTYYNKERDGYGIPGSPYVDRDEIQFGISISLKNLDNVGPRRMGKFWWGDE